MEAITQTDRRTQGHMNKMAEYIEAKNVREFLSKAKVQRAGLFKDEASFEVKGKKKFLP